MKNGKIGVTTENIFPVIKKFLYSDHEIFLRELISNAVDATQKLKTLSSIGEAKGDLGDVTIRVAADKEKKTLTVTDRGVGMTAVVTEAVDNVEGRGAVKVDGKVWSARSEHGETLEPGDLVRVLRIEGVKLYVEKLPVSVR